MYDYFTNNYPKKNNQSRFNEIYYLDDLSNGLNKNTPQVSWDVELPKSAGRFRLLVFLMDYSASTFS